MIRTFQTHRIRRQEELSGALWQFSPCEGEMAGNVYQVAGPSAWECYPDFEAYRGRASYTRRFKVERSGRIRLEFKGVSHTADVFVDGKLAAHHYNAFTPFEAVVNLEAGQHELRVEVDNHYSEDSALHVPNDYQTYGGIGEEVYRLAIDLTDAHEPSGILAITVHSTGDFTMNGTQYDVGFGGMHGQQLYQDLAAFLEEFA